MYTGGCREGERGLLRGYEGWYKGGDVSMVRGKCCDSGDVRMVKGGLCSEGGDVL